ncbi:MAG: hypothetical protein ABIB61_01320 [Candidatus Shapirobacteria bacterium]
MPIRESLPSPASSPSPVTDEDRELVAVVGRIRLAGNEPFAVLALETPEGRNYGIVGEYAKELRELASEGSVNIQARGYIEESLIEVQSYEILGSPGTSP